MDDSILTIFSHLPKNARGGGLARLSSPSCTQQPEVDKTEIWRQESNYLRSTSVNMQLW